MCHRIRSLIYYYRFCRGEKTGQFEDRKRAIQILNSNIVSSRLLFLLGQYYRILLLIIIIRPNYSTRLLHLLFLSKWYSSSSSSPVISVAPSLDTRGLYFRMSHLSRCIHSFPIPLPIDLSIYLLTKQSHNFQHSLQLKRGWQLVDQQAIKSNWHTTSDALDKQHSME